MSKKTINGECEIYVINQETLESEHLIKKTINFLCLFISETLAKRLVCMILISVGVPNSRITDLTGVCDRSVRTYKSSIENNEIDVLFFVGGGGGKSKLANVEEAIIEEINNNNYHDRQQIADMIQDKFKIKVSVATVGRLLKKNKIKRLKCGSLPAKANPAEQRTFWNTVLHPLAEQAKEKKITLLFVDASHFVMGCDFLGYIYGVARRFIKTYSGRKRYNVLGALNFVTKKVTTVTNDTYITSIQICELLKKIAIEYAGEPIYLALDNARYQKCKLVWELANELGIHLMYIPPYSPNLNLVERLWKHVKSKLRTKSYDNFDAFQEKIDSIVSRTDKEDKSVIDKLIGEKPQLFDESICITKKYSCHTKPKKLAA